MVIIRDVSNPQKKIKNPEQVNKKKPKKIIKLKTQKTFPEKGLFLMPGGDFLIYIYYKIINIVVYYLICGRAFHQYK